MKITFVGDIMCEPPVWKGAKTKDGFDFNYVFKDAQPLLDEADFRIGNLETPLAGEAAGWSATFLAFNAPDEYADAVKQARFDLISTSNNHTFDRGYDGMERTIRVLDARGIPHHGSFLPGTERPEAHYLQLGDTKVAVIAYTYGTNYGGSGKKFAAEGDYADTVNLLRPQSVSSYLPGTPMGKTKFDNLTKKFLSFNIRGKIKRFFGYDPSAPRADDNLLLEETAPYVEKMQADIRKAKQNADLVLFYPHMGGQFSHKVGAFSRYIAEKAVEAGADAVIASHSHVVQLIENLNGVPCVNSLGNFNMTPDSGVVSLEHRTGYGIAAHLYIEDKKLQKLTFSIIANVWSGKGIAGCPVDVRCQQVKGKKLQKLEEDVRYVYNIVTGKVLESDVFRHEYEL